MTEVWFIRHGQSAANAGQVTEQPATIPLTPLGHQQSADVAALFTRPPGLIVASPYLRTQETAAPTRTRFPDSAWEIWPIHEFTYLDAGAHANTTIEQRRPFSLAYWEKNDPHYIDGPTAESFIDLVGRITDMVERLKKAEHDFVAVFCHGMVLHTMEILHQQPGIPMAELMMKVHDITSNAHMPNVHIIKGHIANDQLVLVDPSRKVTPCPKPPHP